MRSLAGRRVLVTGHTGFKGTWLAEWLVELGAEVTGLALPPTPAQRLFVDARLSARMSSRLGDVRSPGDVEAAFRAARPELVFHLAAEALVLPARERPVETFATNVLGTVHVLEAARAAPSVRALVIVTSDKCYRDGPRAHGEDDPLGGAEPYAASKAAAELAVEAYRASYFEPKGVRVATVRAGNVIGGGDFAPHRLVPDLVRARAGSGVVVLRRPDAIRPWQHVLDPLAGYLTLGARLLAGERLAPAYNFGPGPAGHRSALALAQRAAERLSVEIRVEPDPRPESPTLHLDSTRAARELGWAPRLDVEAALERTLDFYLAYAASPDRAAELMRADRRAYGELPT